MDTTAPQSAARDSRSDLSLCKWVALLAMSADHVNKYMLSEHEPALFAFGRLAFPLFAAVLGLNLARSGLDSRARWRTIRRLAVVGAVAQIPFIGLGPVFVGWWPLNAMASLLCVAIVVTMLERTDWRGYFGAAAVFAVGGALVEFWWPGLLIGIGAWLTARGPRFRSLAWAGLGLGFMGLGWINDTHWALLALPVLAVARWLPQAPRAKWGFYAYYPLHLGLLWALRAIA